MPSWAIRGTGGRLRAGARVVATLRAWRAEQVGGGRFHVTPTEFDRDPLGWDNHDPAKLVVELQLRTADYRAPARIISTEPFIIETWREEPAHVGIESERHLGV